MPIRKRFATLVAVLTVLITACAPLQVKPIVGDISPGERLHLKVANVTIKNQASKQKFVTGLTGSPESMQSGVQGQFQALLVKELAEILQPEDGYVDSKLKATAILNKASVKMTNKFIKAFPFVSVFFLGLDEQIIASAEGAVEIEDDDGHIVRTAAFKVEATETVNNAFEVISEKVNKVTGKAILELRTQIRSAGKRYLYEYAD